MTTLAVPKAGPKPPPTQPPLHLLPQAGVLGVRPPPPLAPASQRPLPRAVPPPPRLVQAAIAGSPWRVDFVQEPRVSDSDGPLPPWRQQEPAVEAPQLRGRPVDPRPLAAEPRPFAAGRDRSQGRPDLNRGTSRAASRASSRPPPNPEEVEMWMKRLDRYMAASSTGGGGGGAAAAAAAPRTESPEPDLDSRPWGGRRHEPAVDRRPPPPPQHTVITQAEWEACRLWAEHNGDQPADRLVRDEDRAASRLRFVLSHVGHNCFGRRCSSVAMLVRRPASGFVGSRG